VRRAEKTVKVLGKPRASRVSVPNCGLKVGAVLLAAILGLLAYQWLTWPDVASLVSENPKSTAFIARYRERANADPSLPTLQWQWVDYAGISAHVKRAAVVAEDIEFFSHSGFSQAEIAAAVREAFREREVPRGASTITQQTAKNLWLSPSRNPLRKVKEAILTRQLEHRLTKQRILEIYLNVAEFGSGLYGVESAARHYFGKPAGELGQREAALLAASLPRPATWHPDNDSPYYLRYAEDIERRMDIADFLWKYVVSQEAVR
jgi:monofunctional biosynthetic peptidoglycan transglycosylase